MARHYVLIEAPSRDMVQSLTDVATWVEGLRVTSGHPDYVRRYLETVCDECGGRIRGTIEAAEADYCNCEGPQVERSSALLPDQPIYMDDEGTIRFVANSFVEYLLRSASFSLHDLMLIVPASKAEREQFAQLIGYSVAGYGDLSYVSQDSRSRNNARADELCQQEEEGRA